MTRFAHPADAALAKDISEVHLSGSCERSAPFNSTCESALIGEEEEAHGTHSNQAHL
jgi:hypothetical protein